MMPVTVKSASRVGAALLLLCSLFWFWSQISQWRTQLEALNAAANAPDEVPVDEPFGIPSDVLAGAPKVEPGDGSGEEGGSSGNPVEDQNTAPEVPNEAPKSDAAVEGTTTSGKPAPVPGKSGVDGVIVIGRKKSEDTDWVGAELPEWQNAIYVVDDHTAPLHTIANKGREAQVYLTYIIDNYFHLPATIVFLHPHKDGYPGGWHTDARHHSNVASIKALNTAFIQQNGYANLRCAASPGCPDEVQPFRKQGEDEEERLFESSMPEAWFAFFNNTDVPEVLATPCCAQFAVSRDQVLERPREDYERYRTWLLETGLKDYDSGRVFEYLWHVIFGRDPVYCPDKDQCYHDVYGRHR